MVISSSIVKFSGLISTIGVSTFLAVNGPDSKEAEEKEVYASILNIVSTPTEIPNWRLVQRISLLMMK
jgi:hypothetical protein